MMPTAFVRQAQLNSKAVVTHANWLVYHDPNELPTTFDMVNTTEGQARQNGAQPCTHCFARS